MKFLSKIKPIWLICVLAFFLANWINNLNLEALPTDSVRHGQTVITNDDASYLNPPKNYLKHGEWKDNIIGKQAYFNRPPGYGIFYLFALTVTSTESQALAVLKIIQLLLFSLSVAWLFYIACTLFRQQRLAYLIAIIYGILPFTNGFLFYTLSEGITPSLLILFVYLLLKAEEQPILAYKRLIYLLASLCFAHLILVRPILGVFGILLPIFLLKDYLRSGLKPTLVKVAVYSLIAMSLLMAWQTRNYLKAEQYVDLHAIYYEDGNSLYRPTFKSFWNFVGGWAQKGETAHSYMVPMWQNAIQGNASEKDINRALEHVPKKVKVYFGEHRIRQVFRDYQRATLHQKTYFDKEEPMPEEIPAIEHQVIDEFNALTSEFKQKFWVDYYFLSPLKVFKTMAFHSNLNLRLFQNTKRGHLLVEGLRYITFGIHSASFVLLLLSLFFIGRTDWRLVMLSLIAIFYVFYLCYFQRGIEERYTLPILPVLLLIAVGTLRNIFAKLRG